MSGAKRKRDGDDGGGDGDGDGAAVVDRLGSPNDVVARFLRESGAAGVRVTQRSDNHINLLGTLGGQRALLLVSQKPFARVLDGARNGEAPPDRLLAFLRVFACTMHEHNNEWFYCAANAAAAADDAFKVTVVCPATDWHVKKYSSGGAADAPRLVRESPAAYAAAHAPMVAALPARRVKWVADILAGTSEADKVMVRDNGGDGGDAGFVVLPDGHWTADRDAAGDRLHLLCLAAEGGARLRSLRDLRRRDVPLLRRMRDAAAAAVAARFPALPAGALRCYFHYPPSFYWLHLHVTRLHIRQGSDAERAHLVDDVIAFLEGEGDGEAGSYYGATRSLTFALKPSSELHGRLAAHHAAGGE